MKVPENSFKLPLATTLKRAAIQTFFDGRIMRPLLERKQRSERKDTDWLGDHYIYYEPVSESDLGLIALNLKDSEIYTEEESNLFWEACLAVPYECWHQLANKTRDGEERLWRCGSI
jgi:hypothetical protein